MSRLAGRVAIVTGAASGIGRASAQRFAAEGAAVLVADRAEDTGNVTVAAIRARGGRADFVRADVTREADVTAMVEAAVARFGRLDILFNNAGVGAYVPFEDPAPADWDRILDVDLRSVYLGCRAALPHLRRSGGGVILNTASQSGLQGQPMNQAYCAAKAGVILFTRSLARELARENIRVNCICPGGTDTPLLHGYLGSVESPAEAVAELGTRLPMGRVARPEEVAAAALFLVSDDASYVTGVALPVDGGATA
jgi:NAD(P)-dependent dehydrogenase (short-subunit alcohol dehydrogenase family)